VGMETNKSIKIPDNHYVGFQKRSGDEIPLGFMTPDGTDSAATKRKATVDNWARGGGYSSTKQATLPAKTFENKPLVGFKMGKNISYGSGWDSRHDKWRIEDPRGFQLEITSGNLQKVMELCTIERGEIQEPCIWGRLGTENVLIPTASDIYQNAAANTKRMSKKGSIRDAKIGDKLIFKNGQEWIYMGKMVAFGFRKLLENSDESDRHGYYNRNDRYIKDRLYQTLSPKLHYAIAKFSDMEKPETFSAKTLTDIDLKDSLSISEVADYGQAWTQEQMCDLVNEWMYTRPSADEYRARQPDVPSKTSAGEAVILQVAPSAIEAKDFDHKTEWVSRGDWPTFINDPATKKQMKRYWERTVFVHNADRSLFGMYTGMDESKINSGLKPNVLKVKPNPNSHYAYETSLYKVDEIRALRDAEPSLVPVHRYTTSGYSYYGRQLHYDQTDMSHLQDNEIFVSELWGVFKTFSGKEYRRNYTNMFT